VSTLVCVSCGAALVGVSLAVAEDCGLLAPRCAACLTRHLGGSLDDDDEEVRP
jgi:hypothetical protein